MTSSSLPFFSILIPTRNRPDLCADAIKSVLLQTFFDYEVLISNNGSDSDTKVIAKIACDKNPRLNYIEFDNLAMHEHWEQASRHLSGRYLIILTDRCLLFSDSLQLIYEELMLFNYPQIASWKMKQFEDETGILLHEYTYPVQESGATEVCNPKKIFIDELQGKTRSWSEKIPRGLDSAVDLAFIRQMQDNYGSIFNAISPDFTFATFCLLNATTMIFIDKPLYISRGTRVSNGCNAYSGFISTEFVASMGQGFKWFNHVPCKSMLVTNTIFDDYLRTSKACGKELMHQYLDLSSYYSKLLDELKAKADRSLLSKDEICQLSFEIISSVADEKLKMQVGELTAQIVGNYKRFTPKKILLALASKFSPRLLTEYKRFRSVSRREGAYCKSALEAAQNCTYNNRHLASRSPRNLPVHP
jgi:glycosyltransferase involved in cell wall biosynthesis